MDQVQQSAPKDEPVPGPTAPEAKEPAADSQPQQSPPKAEDETSPTKVEELSQAPVPLP